MAKRARVFKSEKRKKELIRKKKQEEKRLRRQKNSPATPGLSNETSPPDAGFSDAELSQDSEKAE